MDSMFLENHRLQDTKSSCRALAGVLGKLRMHHYTNWCKTGFMKKAQVCSPKAPLIERPLLSVKKASELARVFDVLASDTRLRLLHALILKGDPCMSDLAEAVGMKPQAVSNQLRRLVDMGILDTRRHGNNVHYHIVDPCIAKLMYHGLCLNEENLQNAQASAG